MLSGTVAESIWCVLLQLKLAALLGHVASLSSGTIPMLGKSFGGLVSKRSLPALEAIPTTTSLGNQGAVESVSNDPPLMGSECIHFPRCFELGPKLQEWVETPLPRLRALDGSLGVNESLTATRTWLIWSWSTDITGSS